MGDVLLLAVEGGHGAPEAGIEDGEGGGGDVTHHHPASLLLFLLLFKTFVHHVAAIIKHATIGGGIGHAISAAAVICVVRADDAVVQVGELLQVVRQHGHRPIVQVAAAGSAAVGLPVVQPPAVHAAVRTVRRLIGKVTRRSVAVVQRRNGVAVVDAAAPAVLIVLVVDAVVVDVAWFAAKGARPLLMLARTEIGWLIGLLMGIQLDR